MLGSRVNSTDDADRLEDMHHPATLHPEARVTVYIERVCIHQTLPAFLPDPTARVLRFAHQVYAGS